MPEDGSQGTAAEAAKLAREAMAQRNWVTAADHWRQVIVLSPDQPPAYVGAGKSLANAGRLEEAEDVLARGASLFPDHERIALSHAELAHRARNWTLALERWQNLESRFQPSLASALGRFNALRATGRQAESEAALAAAGPLLARALERGEDTYTVRRLAFEIAYSRGELPAAREAAGQLTPPALRADAFLRLAQSHWRARQFAEADEAASRALADDPSMIGALVLRARIATENGEGDAALDLYARLIELTPDVARWRLRRVGLLNWMGRLAEAVRELDLARETWPNEPSVQTMLRTFHPDAHLALDGRDIEGVTSDFERDLHVAARRAPPDSERLRPVVTPELEREVLIAATPGADTIVLIFTGTNDGLSMPLVLFDRFLACANVSAVYLKDFQRLRHLKGIQSLASDYSGSVAALRALVGRLRAPRLMTLGNCAGGAAAIRYGIELGAERIISFDPLADQGVDRFEEVESSRSFLRRRLLANDLGLMADLRAFITSRQHNSNITIHYNDDKVRSRDDARCLMGLSGVRIFGHSAGINGTALRHLALTQDDFGRFLAGLFG